MSALASAAVQFCVSFTLLSGRQIPQIGLGVYRSEPGAETCKYMYEN